MKKIYLTVEELRQIYDWYIRKRNNMGAGIFERAIGSKIERWISKYGIKVEIKSDRAKRNRFRINRRSRKGY